MNLGALLDLGVDENLLRSELSKLDVSGYSLEIKKEAKQGIQGTRCLVNCKEQHGHHHHTHFREIRESIEKSSLSREVKTLAVSIFTEIAEAEGKVHGKPAEEVAFHEVGAVDSIIDIVGAAICIYALKPDKIIATPPELGSGTVTCAHGTLAVPAPAVLEILKGIPVTLGNLPCETTTPTGAGILKAGVGQFVETLSFTPIKTGYGLGSRDLPIPNVLRVTLGNMKPEASEGIKKTCILECNIDDMNPEIYDHVMDKLFSAGADDVYLTPIIMKKSRPGVILRVLAAPDKISSIGETLLNETSTFGYRILSAEKTELHRDFTEKMTSFGPVRIKNGYYKGRRIKSKPEYEDCRKLALEKGTSIQKIYQAVRENNEDAP